MGEEIEKELRSLKITSMDKMEERVEVLETIIDDN
jgi:hypothetical protein